MKKNGFVFAETIVVLTVVCVGLILLYSTFSTVLRREKVRSTYNQSVDIHNLNTIKKYLQAIDVNYNLNGNGGLIVPRGSGLVKNINTGLNSLYFRLECQCHDLVNAATISKYGYKFCDDNYDSKYFNYCADLNNHLNATEIYIIKNNNIKGAITQILNDEAAMEENCVVGSVTERCAVLVSGNTFYVPRFNPSSNIYGIPRRVNATLIDYLKTLAPIESTIEGEDWTNDFIIIGEFYRNGKYYYASLRYEG